MARRDDQSERGKSRAQAQVGRGDDRILAGRG